jgi:TRAP transporter 4TM/12TM fusion protein
VNDDDLVDGNLAVASLDQGASSTLLRHVIRVFALAFAIFAIVEVNLYHFSPFQERALFLMFPLSLCFLIRREGSPSVLDYVFAAASLVCCGYIVVEYNALLVRMGAPTTIDVVMGTIASVVVLEATRRAAGLALPIIAALFMAYAYFGAALPTYLGGHAGYEFNRIITQSFLTMEGIFGIALSVMFTYVFPFILFGTVLEAVGALGFAIDLAESIFGRFRGGPAKVAVVASGMVGMINGSAVANVVTAGALTIPMMKRVGFEPHVAGAIEAVASTGGQLMPPVMGAAAFMMAEFLGVPYLTVAKGAAIPALLYYLALFTAIHFYSVRYNIGGVATPRRSGAASMLVSAEFYLFTIPVACLLWFMLTGLSATKSVSYALIAAFVTSLFVKHQRLTLSRVSTVLEKSAKDAVSLTCAAACVGIIIGMTVMTALGSRFTSIIIDMSAGNIYLALALVMVSSIILGLGLPTTICYVLLATLAGPALVDLGIPPLSAHMFILYFGMMSMVTPPDAMAAYAGAAIAGADMWKTGITASMFSLAGYLLPFMFVLNPAYLMIGTVPEILMALLTGAVGVMALGVLVAGHLRMPLMGWERAALLTGAIILIAPHWYADIAALAVFAPVLLRQYGPSPIKPSHAQTIPESR